jgi:hypothetical protein
LLFFVLIAFEKTTGFGKLIEKLPVAGNFYMIACLLLGWVLFRADSGQAAIAYLRAMFGLAANPAVGSDTYRLVHEYAFTWVIAIVGCMPVAKRLASIRFSGTFAVSLLKWAYLAFVFTLSAALISGSDYNPFIYFNF